MARLVGVLSVAHSPFCYMEPERWNEVRASRSLRADVPRDDLATNRAKAARIQSAFAALRERLSAARPDVLVVFGDDQLERFDFGNFPSFAVYVGAQFDGALWAGRVAGVRPHGADAARAPMARLSGHPELGTALLAGLMERGFDPAFCMDTEATGTALGHAFVRPAESLTDLTTPIVPVLLNCYYAPQPTGRRCYQLGVAVAEVIAAYPGDLRVAVIGSGGLWHTPRAADAYLDEAFDRAMLAHMEAGDPEAMAKAFDAYVVPPGDRSQDAGPRGPGVTGMPSPGGPQGGTRETCNWIAAAGAAGRRAARVVDYVPVYASPVGAAFAYWPDLSP